ENSQCVYFYHFPNFLKNSSDQRPEVSICALPSSLGGGGEVKGSLLSFSSNRVIDQVEMVEPRRIELL
ncbi:hypothetical protein, partial [Pseudomonas oryzihabitans]|uniref:hypothetical protein n=1 Tax=Pseudomonas oryzihabitans TaxID=47885 RepID=UPI001C930B13